MLHLLVWIMKWRERWRAFRASRAERADVPVEPDAEFDIGPDEPTVAHWVGPWVALRHGGGGRFDIPKMAADDAIEYVTRRGSHSIMHIDHANHYIFYADKR